MPSKRSRSTAPTDPPLCSCHDEPTYWHTDPRRKAGGTWRCRIARRDLDRRSWSKAVRVGRRYFGRAATPEEAAQINARGRQMLNDFKSSQKEERDAGT